MRTTLIAATLTGLLLLTGCNGGGDPSPAPTASSGGSETSSTGDPSPTEPAVAPADGPVLDGDVSTVNAPRGWKVNDFGIPFNKNATDDKRPGVQSLDLNESAWGAPSPLDEMAQRALADFPAGKVKRQPNVSLDGEEAYHISGTDEGTPYDEVGLTSHDRKVSIILHGARLSPAQRADLLASVVASFRWKG